MKRIIVATLLTSSIVMVGCAKEIKTETVKAKAIVKELEYDEAYTTTIPVSTDKSVMIVPQYHPAEYEVTVDYKGVDYEVDNEKAYKKVEGKLYKPVDCEFTVKYYDDGTTKTTLNKIEGVNVEND